MWNFILFAWHQSLNLLTWSYLVSNLLPEPSLLQFDLSFSSQGQLYSSHFVSSFISSSTFLFVSIWCFKINNWKELVGLSFIINFLKFPWYYEVMYLGCMFVYNNLLSVQVLFYFVDSTVLAMRTIKEEFFKVHLINICLFILTVVK